MNDIEVGEYVRTNLGIIGKVTDRYINYPEPFELMLDKKHSLHEIEMEQKGEEIVKHSKNIIDVLEVGDRVEYKTNMYIKIGEVYDEKIMEEIRMSKVLSVLTHEQIEANCYRLEK